MNPFPHKYTAFSAASPSGDVPLSSPGLPTLDTASPPEFDGPGGRWSPETLLVGAVANCFILTFRAIAKASKLPWASLTCDVEGKLDRIDRVTRFTEITVRARLEVLPEANEEQAHRLLVKAEETCLVTRSLNAAIHLDAHVRVLEPVDIEE